ncbi:thioesterase domain-containing protein [Bacterioplanoides pacificum]|uniref:Thioesterase domain-containing protein n=1 Tax=Bacterioplanoides pacificum TaxID=1171596 RepID=A0ABV7VR79_9GAMM
MNTDISQKLKDFFVEHLPITQFMGLEVESYDGEQLVLSAPLAPNINDKQTAFGGSLYNAAVMACWGFAYLKTQEKGLVCNQVVAGGEVKYLAPVTGKIRAVCKNPGDKLIASFLDHFNRKGRAKISLQAEISCDGEVDSAVAVTFSGQYAILAE